MGARLPGRKRSHAEKVAEVGCLKEAGMRVVDISRRTGYSGSHVRALLKDYRGKACA